MGYFRMHCNTVVPPCQTSFKTELLNALMRKELAGNNSTRHEVKSLFLMWYSKHRQETSLLHVKSTNQNQ